MVVVGVRLHEVDDIEAVNFIFPRVLHSEEVPLSEAICAIVVLQIQVILTVADFDCFAKVCTLKATFEDQSLVLICRLF